MARMGSVGRFRLEAWPSVVVLVLMACAIGTARVAKAGEPQEQGRGPLAGNDAQGETLGAGNAPAGRTNVPLQAAAPSEPPSPAPPPVLHVLASANLDGQIAQVDCRATGAEGHGPRHYAQLVGLFHALAQHTQKPPIALSLGDLAFPGPLGRFGLGDGPEGPARLADLLSQMPWHSWVPGNRELGLAPEARARLFAELRRRGLPLGAANLACEPFGGAEDMCTPMPGPAGASEAFRIVVQGGVRVGLLTLMDPGLAPSMDPLAMRGLRLLDPVDVAMPLVAEMRRTAGVDLVFVLYHVSAGHSLARAQHLATQVEGIDLLWTNHLPGPTLPEVAGQSGSAAAALVAHTGTWIVSADTGPERALVARLPLVARQKGHSRWALGGLGPQALALEPLSQTPEDPRTAQRIDEARARYCAAWGQPIAPNLPLERPFAPQDLQRFVLHAMREAARAEIAMLNAGALRPKPRPITGTLTLSDIYAALPYDNQPVVANVRGKHLKMLVEKSPTDWLGAGLERAEGKILVNGRPLNEARLYRVVTNDFMARGGDDLLAPEHWEDARRLESPGGTLHTPTLAELVTHVVRSLPPQTLSLNGNFANLHDRFLWLAQGSVNAAYNTVSVYNPAIAGAPAYTQSQLAATPTDQLNLEGKAFVVADSRQHAWEQDLLAQYATARLTSGEGADFDETRDLVRYQARYRFMGLQSSLGTRWWVPNPLAEVQLETEFDRPETRDWHRLETTAIAGVSFALLPELNLKLGINTRRDLLRPGAETTLGLHAGYRLRRREILSLSQRPVHLESELEYFFNDLGAARIHEIRNDNRLFFALSDTLFFTTTWTGYFYRTAQVGDFGRNTALTVGLNYVWDAAAQTF